MLIKTNSRKLPLPEHAQRIENRDPTLAGRRIRPAAGSSPTPSARTGRRQSTDSRCRPPACLTRHPPAGQRPADQGPRHGCPDEHLALRVRSQVRVGNARRPCEQHRVDQWQRGRIAQRVQQHHDQQRFERILPGGNEQQHCAREMRHDQNPLGCSRTGPPSQPATSGEMMQAIGSVA